ncbi:MAG: hypothetical protein GY765_43390 [bacterium]|nr:hypothetical protein [bacterium]
MIHTVTGSIEKADLGIVRMHEHILWAWTGEARERFSRETVVNTMLPFLRELKTRGCRTLVEATTHGAGRDVSVLREISIKSGLNIITNSGVWDGLDFNGLYVPEILRQKEMAEIADMWMKEFFDGIDGTDIKPGFIKLGFGDNNEITDFHKKCLMAAVKTSLHTGLTIQSHICSSKSALEAVKIIENTDLALDEFIWTHADFSRDAETILLLARKGIWVELNWWITEVADYNWHINLIQALERENLLHRVLLSQDAGGFHNGEVVPYSKFFTDFIPSCRNGGISNDSIDILLIHNPAAALNLSIS